MGQSTDAYLFYGYHLPEDYDMPEEVSEIWKGEVLVDTHCSGDYPMWFVFVEKSRLTAARGYPKEVASLTKSDNWNTLVCDFARKHNLPEPGDSIGEYGGEASEIGWWLVSYWG